MSETSEAKEAMPAGAAATPRIDPVARASFWLAMGSLLTTMIAALLAVGGTLIEEAEIIALETAFTIADTAKRVGALLEISAIFIGLPMTVVAAVLALISLGRIAERPGQLAGKRRALWGGATAMFNFFLVVFAVIPIVGSMRPSHQSYEAIATSSLRTLNTALGNFAATYHKGFPDTLRKLGPMTGSQPDENNADLVNDVLSGRAKRGAPTSFVKAAYRVTYHPGPRNPLGQILTYTLTARPILYEKSPRTKRTSSTGVRSFYTDESGVIRATTEDRGATINDPPL